MTKQDTGGQDMEADGVAGKCLRRLKRNKHVKAAFRQQDELRGRLRPFHHDSLGGGCLASRGLSSKKGSRNNCVSSSTSLGASRRVTRAFCSLQRQSPSCKPVLGSLERDELLNASSLLVPLSHYLNSPLALQVDRPAS